MRDNPTTMLATGVARAFKGARSGDQPTLLTGAALVAVALWRRSGGKKKELLYRRTVKVGSSIVVRHGSGERIEIHKTG